MCNDRAKLKNNENTLNLEQKRMRSNSTNEISLKPKVRRRSRSFSLFNKELIENTLHDSFFNNKRKAKYETELAEIFLNHLTPFMPILKKVSSIILHDLQKSLKIDKQDSHALSEKMRVFLLNDFDLKILFNSTKADDEMLSALQSDDPHTFYKQMCLQFTYITFFTRGNLQKPELSQAVANNWCEKVDLLKLMSDMTEYRNEESLFKNYHRLSRNYIKNKETTSIGILPPEEYLNVSYEKKSRLLNKLPKHQAGMFQFFITTVCDSTSEAMHRYDLPQLCGPSGTTAKRLALANQANLTNEEMQLMHFAIALFNVAIGAHTLDECFMIANQTEFCKYIRGNYMSIIPDVIKSSTKFFYLWNDIQLLNDKNKDILISTASTKLKAI